jgi:hypothetical protein
MNAMLLLVVATLGVDFTYHPNAAGQTEYHMTIESELVPQMVQGKGVRSVIPQAALGGRVLRLQVPKTNHAGLIDTVNQQPLLNAISQGVRFKADGTYEYVVQIDPASIELFKSGRPILVSLDPALDSASELIIISGVEQLGSFASVIRAPTRNPVALNGSNPRNTGPTPADPATRNIGDNQVRPAQFSQQAGVNERISIPPNALQSSPTQPRPLPQNLGNSNFANSNRRNPAALGNPPAVTNPLDTRPLVNPLPHTRPLANSRPLINTAPRMNSAPRTNVGPVNPNPLPNNNGVPNNANRNGAPLGPLVNSQINPNIPGVGRPFVRPLDPSPAFTNPINNQLQNFKNGQVGNNVGPIGNPAGPVNSWFPNGQPNNVQPQAPFNPSVPANTTTNNNQLRNVAPLAPNGGNVGGWSAANPNSLYPNPNGVRSPDNNRLANLGQQNPRTNSPMVNANGQVNPQFPNNPYGNVGVTPNGQNPAQNNIYQQNGNPSLAPNQNPAMSPNPAWPGNQTQPNSYSPKDQQFLAALNSLATKIDQIDKKANGGVVGTLGVHTPATAAQAANLAMLNEMKRIADSIKTAQNPALTNQTLNATAAHKVATALEEKDEKKKLTSGPISFLLLAFCLSLAANAWLAWVAWDYVERYQHLSDDVRSSRTD